MDAEVSFPRGGSKPPKRSKPNKNENIFAEDDHDDMGIQSPKKRKISETSDVFDAVKEVGMISADLLTYQKIQEGMLILGAVHKINALYLEVELPGRIFGKVEVGNLSSVYVNHLQQSLENNCTDADADLQKLDKLYFVGQILPTKVISVKRLQHETKVYLSIDPTDIHEDLNIATCKPGRLLWAAISAKSDHGYILDVGKENWRVFLPFNNVEENTEFEIGCTIWCVIKKSEVSSGMSIMTVSAISNEVLKTTQHSMNLHNIIPGMQFPFTITKILRDGLEGKLPNERTGYINQVYLKKPLQALTKFRVGSTYEARLLYVEPLTKFAFLTLRKIDEHEKPQHSIGAINTVKVISKTHGGIYVTLSNNDKGFISDKRLIENISEKANVRLETYIKSKFQKGSTHQVKIMCYNPLEQIYVCTPKRESSKKAVITTDQLNIGDLVNVVVTESTAKGVCVKVGKVKGFIQNIHLSNIEYSNNIKKIFVDGKNLQVRVWSIDIPGRGIFFTNKQSLVKSDLHFSSYEDVIVNQQYLGIVAYIRNDGSVMMIFYGNIKGFLHKPKTVYFIGQVVLTTVVEKRDGELVLSLEQPSVVSDTDWNVSEYSVTKLVKQPDLKISEYTDIKVGEYTDAKVVAIHSDCLMVRTKHNIKVKVPVSHLSSYLSLNRLLLGTYKVGDHISSLLCLRKDDELFLSIREAVEYKNLGLKVCSAKDIKSGTILRGFCISQQKSVITICIPLIDNMKTLEVLTKDIFGTSKSTKIKFDLQQPILLKVVHFDKVKDTLQVTGKLSNICEFNSTLIERPLDYLENYLHNFKKVRNHIQTKSSLADLCIGQHVQCEVVKCNDGGCVVWVNNTKVQGLVHRRLCPEQVKVGQKLKGQVLWVDIKFVHLVLVDSIIETISDVQDGNNAGDFNTTLKAKVLLVSNEFVIAVLLNTTTDNQLVFLPTFIHENMFSVKRDHYNIFEVIKVISLRKVGDFLIGLDKEHKRWLKNAVNNNNKVCNTQTMINTTIAKPTPSKKSEVNSKSRNNHIIPDSSNIISDDESMHSENDENNVSSHNHTDVSKTIKTNNELIKPKINKSLDSGLSGMNKFYSINTLEQTHESDESDDDENNSTPTPKKKKKLSGAERAELAKEKEEQIRKKELENANLAGDPQSPDQFDKLLLGNPNNSELWAKYIAYYVTQTEFDKARSIAKRALKSIDLNQYQERLNIWVILLRLENNHGDKETFEEVFEEAVRSNDPLEIYLTVISMLSESHKHEEMEAKIKKARNKFKQELKMWTSIAAVYFENKMLKEARDVRDSALKTITNNKDQYNLIVQFALMEFRNGDFSTAEALFETLLQSNPKKVNIWSTYIDQVIKKTGDIAKARRIFNRAIAQDLPIKRKRSLFNKYKQFEVQYGTSKTFDALVELIKHHLGTAD